MKRISHLVVGACAAAFLATGGIRVAEANVLFNFNATDEGWTFGTETTPQASGTDTPTWSWAPGPSSSEGALDASLTVSSSAVGAWAMSPCLEVVQNENQQYVHVDMSHWTKLPDSILGQVQFRVDLSGTGWGPWQGISGTSWLVGGIKNHVPPTEANVFPPLLSSTATIPGPNVYLAFSGTNYDSSNPQGPHVLSAFDIQWADTGLSNGAEIQFRLLVGVNTDVPTQSPAEILWELNEFQIDGVKVCAVPEPGTLTLAVSAISVVLVAGGLRTRAASKAARAHRSQRNRPNTSP